jgi:hypothetical protein
MAHTEYTYYKADGLQSRGLDLHLGSRYPEPKFSIRPLTELPEIKYEWWMPGQPFFSSKPELKYIYNKLVGFFKKAGYKMTEIIKMKNMNKFRAGLGKKNQCAKFIKKKFKGRE